MGRSNNVSPSVTLTPPVWAAEQLDAAHLVPGAGKLLLSDFRAPDAVLVKINGAGQNAGATSITVDALTGPIPNGTVLHFGGAKFAKVNDANVAAGDTTITVLALPTNLADNDEAWYSGDELTYVPSGTVVGRTFAEMEAGTRYGLAASGDEDVLIVAFAIDDITQEDGDFTGVKPGTVIKENFLPNWSNLSSAVKALVRAKYVTQIGVA